MNGLSKKTILNLVMISVLLTSCFKQTPPEIDSQYPNRSPSSWPDTTLLREIARGFNTINGTDFLDSGVFFASTTEKYSKRSACVNGDQIYIEYALETDMIEALVLKELGACTMGLTVDNSLSPNGNYLSITNSEERGLSPLILNYYLNHMNTQDEALLDDISSRTAKIAKGDESYLVAEDNVLLNPACTLSSNVVTCPAGIENKILLTDAIADGYSKCGDFYYVKNLTTPEWQTCSVWLK